MKRYSIMFILFFTLFIGCEKKLSNVEQIDKITENLLPTITDFKLIKTKRGKTIWEINANKAVIDESNNIITIKKGKIKISDGNTYVADVMFDLARYNTVTNNIFFPGENVVTTIENEKIITYDINYIYAENKIFSEKEIAIYKGDNIIKGIGFESLDGFQTIRIYKNVITTK